MGGGTWEGPSVWQIKINGRIGIQGLCLQGVFILRRRVPINRTVDVGVDTALTDFPNCSLASLVRVVRSRRDNIRRRYHLV